MKERVWITGVNGFVGRNFAAYVRRLSGPFELVGLDIGISSEVELERYASIDIVDLESMVEFAKEYPPTHILHCAASVFESDADCLWKVNVRGTAVLLDSLRMAGLENVRIVSIGSAAEYSLSSGIAISETSRVGPISEYGRSKLAQSLLALSLATVTGQRVIIARTFNLIGPGISTNLVPGAMLARLGDTSSNTLRVFDATSSRDFVDVRDAVAAYWTLLINGKGNNIYNVCGGVSTEIANLAQEFVENLSRDVRVVIDRRSTEATPASHVFGSNEKIREDTGWVPRISVAESVADMVRGAGL